MTAKKQDMFNVYLGKPIRVIEAGIASFQGTLKDFNEKYVTLFPYVGYRVSEDELLGTLSHQDLINEGEPLRIERGRGRLVVYLIKQDEIEYTISDSKRRSRIEANKLRLEEITNELNLKDMEEAHRKKFNDKH